jgi:hypothetical protein
VLSSCFGSGIDYLFVEILSAPTADVTKVEALEALKATSANLNMASSSSTEQGVNTSGRRRKSVMVTSVSRPTLTRADRRRSAVAVAPLITDAEARIVPSELMVAHKRASISFGRVMNDRKGRVDQSCRVRQTRRQSNIDALVIAEGGRSLHMSLLGQEEIRTPHSTRPSFPSNKVGDAEDAYRSLMLELRLERDQMTSESEREVFEHEWGYECLLLLLTALMVFLVLSCAQARS